MRLRICLEPPPTRLARDVQHPVGRPSRVPPWLVTDPERGRNVDRLSIGYACRPRLRSRLTLRGRTFRKNPWPYGGQDSSLPFFPFFPDTQLRFLPLSLRSC